MPTETEPGDEELRGLSRELLELRSEMLNREIEGGTGGEPATPCKSRSNLCHYLSLRRNDIRALQERLSRLGLSSLGRSEAHVLHSVDSVLAVLARLRGERLELKPSFGAPDFDEGRALLVANADALFGPRPQGRAARIMVTLPGDASGQLIGSLLEGGIDAVRINCAHDDPSAWERLVTGVRAEAQRTGRHCAVHMDMGGPKLRTSGPPSPLSLAPGDGLFLAKADDGGPIESSIPTIGCTLPDVLDMVRPGEPVWFDDGKLGGVVDRVEPRGAFVRITYARHGRRRLRPDRGMNFPESRIDIPGFTAKDREDLDFIAKHADSVGLSFAQRVEDVRAVRERVLELGKPSLGLVLKIETRRGFEALPRLLLESARNAPLGVMIARGDLAVEIGYERLAEVQEEILWICEAAHVPVIWATQVLESLSKDGMPTRAEITDAAMAERTECVMLNKGEHVVETVRILDDILRRMGGHQHKKSATLRALGVSNPSTPSTWR
jgi:pyruvate kinase